MIRCHFEVNHAAFFSLWGGACLKRRAVFDVAFLLFVSEGHPRSIWEKKPPAKRANAGAEMVWYVREARAAYERKEQSCFTK